MRDGEETRHGTARHRPQLAVVFNELLRQRRVSAVAETLGITQPAISNALNRLRKLLGDELFIRTRKG